MKIVFLSHPSFLGHQSMPRFTNMLRSGMEQRGHQVEVLSPIEKFSRIGVPGFIKKWLQYIDQYVVFVLKLRRKLKTYDKDTLFVITDHALGPWVPLVKDRPHVIHCHDFLAQRSALGQIPENRTGWTGRSYQAFIRKGYSAGRNFISVSKHTRQDLHEFLGYVPPISEVVYKGLDKKYSAADQGQSRAALQSFLRVNVSDGYILHVGGNQWYKNRVGVIHIYNAWRKLNDQKLPLLLFGETPDAQLKAAKDSSPYNQDIYFATNADDTMIRYAYSGATLLLFPSLAEGFGWPIAEAMACGCIVVTTHEAPMTEVGEDVAQYIPRMPHDLAGFPHWTKQCAEVVDSVVQLSPQERSKIVGEGYRTIKRFDIAVTLTRIEEIYKNCVLTMSYSTEP
jgi:glycosyltransferase involved in cell wall biosynthesis